MRAWREGGTFKEIEKKTSEAERERGREKARRRDKEAESWKGREMERQRDEKAGR